MCMTMMSMQKLRAIMLAEKVPCKIMTCFAGASKWHRPIKPSKNVLARCQRPDAPQRARKDIIAL